MDRFVFFAAFLPLTNHVSEFVPRLFKCSNVKFVLRMDGLCTLSLLSIEVNIK